MIQHHTEDGRRVYTADEAATLRGENVKTVQTRLLRAGVEPAGWINPRLAVYYAKDIGLEDTMATLDLSQTAAAVIFRARANSPYETAAEFDYDIAVHYDRSVNGVGGVHSPLGAATYEIAEERGADFEQLWTDLQPELQAYAQRCRDRKYAGWSTAARGRGARITYA